MKLKLILAGIFSCILINAAAQTAGSEKADKPEGKAIISVFSNLHSGFGKNGISRGFELERAYLGYEYKLKNGLSLKGVTDIGKPSGLEDYQRLVYIKNALVSWKKDDFSINGGLISTTIFGFQEKFWGHRYIMKSFQDEYKFGSSADLGVSVSYRFADWISADAIAVNGEGYKKIQINNGLNYGAGITLNPFGGLFLRIYGGLNEYSGDENGKNTVNIASFIGYRHENFRIGAEYNYMHNAEFIDGYDKSGLSVYSTVDLCKTTSIFARYDNLFYKGSPKTGNDKSSIMAGAEIRLGKYVKIAPNLRMNMPDGEDAKWSYAGYISCFFGIN